MAALVSIVIPVGRIEPALSRQLEALAAQQTDRSVEIVLARNTTEPGAAEALDLLVGTVAGDRIRVVDATERRGASHARNAGAAAAAGDVLAFCDADDVVHEGWIEAITGALHRFDAAGGRLIDVGLSERYRRARPPATPDALPTFLGVPYMGSGNMAISHQTFDAVGGFDEALHRCEDIALSWSLLAGGHTIGFASDAVVDYHHRPGVRSMVRQHVGYGRGMAQVLVRYGIPVDGGWSHPRGLALLRPNPQSAHAVPADADADAAAAATSGRPTALGVLRRASLAAGRLWGVAEARLGGGRERRPANGAGT